MLLLMLCPGLAHHPYPLLECSSFLHLSRLTSISKFCEPSQTHIKNTALLNSNLIPQSGFNQSFMTALNFVLWYCCNYCMFVKMLHNWLPSHWFANGSCVILWSLILEPERELAEQREHSLILPLLRFCGSPEGTTGALSSASICEASLEKVGLSKQPVRKLLMAVCLPTEPGRRAWLLTEMGPAGDFTSSSVQSSYECVHCLRESSRNSLWLSTP